jgi:hypothetical protein
MVLVPWWGGDLVLVAGFDEIIRFQRHGLRRRPLVELMAQELLHQRVLEFEKARQKQVLEIKVKLGGVEVFCMWDEARKDAYSTVLPYIPHGNLVTRSSGPPTAIPHPAIAFPEPTI